jgi:hypothetical protein
MRQHPPSFGIVSRDCYDANLLTALRVAQARAEAAEARVMEVRVMCAAQARLYASYYPQSSDGQNTFILLAEWIENLG